MTTDDRTSAPHLAIGLCFLLLGVFLLLDRLGWVDIARILEYWPLVLVLVGISMMVQATRGSNGRNDFPAGALILLVIVAIVASRTLGGRDATSGERPENDVTLSAVFSGRRATVTDTFQAARLTSVMGGTVLDLRQATVPPGEDAVIDLFALMGGAVVHVPAHWVVDVQSTVVMGGVNDDRNGTDEDRPRRRVRPGAAWDGDVDLPEPPPPSPAPPVEPADAAPSDGSPPPRLVVRGFVMMGGLTIKP